MTQYSVGSHGHPSTSTNGGCLGRSCHVLNKRLRRSYTETSFLLPIKMRISETQVFEKALRVLRYLIQYRHLGNSRDVVSKRTPWRAVMSYTVRIL
jgi:hypothetical protein